jgi:hypothetical protein
MKWIIRKHYPISIIFLIVMVLCTSTALLFSFNPEHRIKGKWKETSWSYENINKEDFSYHDVILNHKHQSEAWRFMRNNRLYFYNGGNITTRATWRIKGRGQVLQLTYDDGDIEVYDIKELNDQHLIINFNIGMQSRGIARLVFTKTSNQ